uniref:fibroblast growth factor-binding protein 2b n=1 Tax=Doryrhamphus excisus TaxID=161450 RepID=UPI0025AEB046|nr:fibroblast growth factor-binding protein 2b [Doryrhamphus excisus]
MKARAPLHPLLPLLCMAALVCASAPDTDGGVGDSNKQRSVWDEPVRFSTKSKDSCTMAVSAAGDHTRLRVSCKGPGQGQAAGRSYHCDFQGKPDLCRAYTLNPRHYFTQMMWELRKLGHACQGAKIYRPPMCKKHPDDVQMTFLSAWPRTAKASKPAQATRKPPRPQPVKPHPGKVPQARKTTPKPAKATARPTEPPQSKASRMASEYCWKSFHGICSYVLGWFHN